MQKVDIQLKLLSLSYRKIINLHKKVFKAYPKFRIATPPGFPIHVMRDRIYNLWCMKNATTPLEKSFHRQWLKNSTQSYATRRVNKYATLTEHDVDNMKMLDIYNTLAAIGVSVAVQHREVLKEILFGKARLKHRRRVGIRKVLVKAILEHPYLSYRQFYKKFKGQIPNVSSGYFRKTKQECRQAGFEIPDLTQRDESINPLPREQTTFYSRQQRETSI